MIIWGWRGREVVDSSGQFFCPQCGSQEGYKRIRVATYFTLYFIPLFPTEEHGEYVLCLRCKGKFKIEVLEITPRSQAERVLSGVTADLERGTPLQTARAQLLSGGMPPEAAEPLIATAAGKTRQCPACSLTFVWSRVRCSGCDTLLP